ncbi:hypothetical protein AALO_G00059780 [Alosa alosa]|uniref:Uncharacterized protein n=1 Tax=Alosa alosa TaxID=278164 RepID=A0AAV6HB39_9TELE|nr:hypothetical protein AALO_G00059780 [Alosa alosa]
MYQFFIFIFRCALHLFPVSVTLGKRYVICLSLLSYYIKYLHPILSFTTIITITLPIFTFCTLCFIYYGAFLFISLYFVLSCHMV